MARAAISRVQALAIKELYDRDPGFPSLATEARANLVCLVSDAPWVSSDMEEVLRMLAHPEPQPKAPRNQNPQQVWAPAILGYLPESVWESLRNCGSVEDSQSCVIGWVVHMGGRMLSEPTYKCLTSLSIMFGDKEYKALPASSKMSLYDLFKKEFKKRAKEAGPPGTWLEHLDATPQEMRRSKPTIYAGIYTEREGPPVPARADLRALMALNGSYKCRRISASDTDAPRSSGSDALTLMSQMMAMQQQNFQLVLSQSNSNHSSKRSLQGMAAPPRAPGYMPEMDSPHEGAMVPFDAADAPTGDGQLVLYGAQGSRVNVSVNPMALATSASRGTSRGSLESQSESVVVPFGQIVPYDAQASERAPGAPIPGWAPPPS